jgi:hypothetical protein
MSIGDRVGVSDNITQEKCPLAMLAPLPLVLPSNKGEMLQLLLSDVTM